MRSLLRPAFCLPALLAACALGGAAEPAAPAALLVVTAADWSSDAALAAEAARRAGVPVRRAAAVGPRLYAVTLECSSAVECRGAVARLAADPGFATDVQPDSRRTLPPRPTASSAQ
jgi:hypothetical protein